MIDLLGAWGEASSSEMFDGLRLVFAHAITAAPQVAHLHALLGRLEQLDSAEQMAGAAFDQAAIWQWPDLADAVAQLRDRLLPASPSWSSAPELDTWDRSARWWSRHVALICLLGMRVQPEQAAGLGATARDVIQATAWRSSEPASRSTVLTLYTWAIEQSPIPAGATWTREFLMRDLQAAGYKVPSTWAIVKGGAQDAWNNITDIFPDTPGEIAGWGLGLAVLVGTAVIVSIGPTATVAAIGRRRHATGH